MTTYTEKPSWFYKPIHVEKLEIIQKELATLVYNKIPDSDNSVSNFIIVQRKEIEPIAPVYTKFIESLGLLDRWARSSIVTTNNHIPFPIHIDNANWLAQSYGLNIPVINCEDTYTVWYDVELESKPNSLVATDAKGQNRIAKRRAPSTEIARWHMKDPAWINVSIPHRPVSNHGRFRAVVSSRFEPELHDILYK
jgi:hypothetical protein